MRTRLKVGVLLASILSAVAFSFHASAQQKALDPAAWGSNHAGKPVPEYVPGDECLFCHRNDVGPGWQKNTHNLTVRQGEDAPEHQALVKSQPALAGLASQIEFFLGSRHRVRFLKKDGYGKFALLNTQADLPARKLIDADKPSWDRERFANKCAGCHTTGVDSKTKAFSAFGIDCYSCHGVVDLNHSSDTSLVFLSKKRRDDARAITSTCAQCHIRTGKSRSTGLPYPNNFVAGDNLFQDFEVDLSKADDEALNAGDRHVLRNVRDVALYGSESPTCISCHDVHKQSSLKHRRAPRSAICADCHDTSGSIKGSKPFTVHSPLCEY
ncbi:MAG TPA: multiheme c-type cytochrome [Blastocatellia bacterium]|nr:multiheme c-type cytochrome [Blastocatellia bacterium]